jgi:hypothetical protein
MCRAEPSPTRSAAAAGLLELAHGKKKQCARGGSKRAEPTPAGDLTLERWALVVDGAHVSSLGRYRAPGSDEPRTVHLEGRCARVHLNGQVLRVDKLVAGAFLPLPAGAPSHMMRLVHLDGDCHNDAETNLQWMLPDEKRRHGADPTRAASTTYKHCPLPVVKQLLLQQARLPPPAPQLGALDPDAEIWVELEAHRNARNLCPAVSSFGSYRAAGKKTPHHWREGQARAVSINGRKIDLDRLVASAFVPKTCALADQLVHLDGDDSNCRADNLAWHTHPSRDPARAASAVYAAVAPPLAERAAAFYRRKTRAPQPEPTCRAEYLLWARDRSVYPIHPSFLVAHSTFLLAYWAIFECEVYNKRLLTRRSHSRVFTPRSPARDGGGAQFCYPRGRRPDLAEGREVVPRSSV